MPGPGWVVAVTVTDTVVGSSPSAMTVMKPRKRAKLCSRVMM